MADEENQEGASEEGEGKKKGGLMKILVMVLAALLLIIISVGATLYLTGFFDMKKEVESTEVIEDLEKTMVDENGKPIVDKGPEKQKKEFPDPQKFEQSYQDFKAKFTSNVPGSKKYVQFSLSVMTYYDERVLGNVDKHEIALRSAVLSLVAQEPIETYQNAESMDKLREKIKFELNRVLMKYEDFGGIEEVYFTELVLQ